MCGIAGIIYRSKERQVTQGQIAAMMQTLEHRGPDGFGTFVSGNVGIGMRRLSIVDAEKHEIPYLNEDRTLMLAYNGEVYNHVEIRSALRERHQFRYDSDTETVLHAFEEDGIGAFKYFNGMYACAFYDKPNGRVTLVRDKVGEKPLYYYSDQEKLVFASEIKAILTAIDPELNENPPSYSAFEFCSGKETLFKNVYALEPGEFLEFEGDQLKVQSYWKVWDNLVTVPDDETKIVRQLSELLEDAVLLRKRNTVHQFGCLVSGGVDSSLVACISRPDYLYTLTYDIDDDFNELPFAELVAKHIGRDLVVVRPTKEDYVRYRDEILYYLDMPATWSSFNLYMIMRRVRDDIKVILSGEGADELFGGYHRYHLLVHDEKIYRLKALSKYGYLVQKYYGTPASRYCRLINRNENQFDENCNRYLDETISFYFEKSPSVIHGMGLTDFYTTMQVLLTMADRMSMAFAIENRSPFLDYRLVQYAFAMPDRFKIKNGITKYILKKIAKKFIPIEIVNRIDKRGFVAPVNIWFGWGERGKYSRYEYRTSVFEAWKRIFFTQEGRQQAQQWAASGRH